MKQTNKKYISKEMAMMAALTMQSILLHENYDALLYWAPNSKRYTIVVEYVNDNPIEKYPNFSCSCLRNYIDEVSKIKEVSLDFEY